MKKIKRILIPKNIFIGIYQGKIKKEIVLNKRANLIIQASKHKNYLDDPESMYVEIFYVTN